MTDPNHTPAVSPRGSDDLPDSQWAFDDFAADEDRPAADPGSGLVSLGFILAALRRSARLWYATAVLGLLAGIGTYVALPPAFQASASILLTNSPNQQPSEAMLDNSTIAQSRSVAGAALRKLGLRQSVTSFIGDYTVFAATGRVLVFTVNATSSADAIREANALISTFLTFQAQQMTNEDRRINVALRQKIRQNQQHIDSISSQISKLSAQPATPGRQAKLSHLRTERVHDTTALAMLKQASISNQANMQTSTATVVQGSQVLDAAVPVPQSRLKLRLIYAATGLIIGLALGVGFVVVRALVSDRLRRRDDVASALGAPVKLSVGTVRRSRWRPGRRGLAAARGAEVRRVAAYLGSAMPPRSGDLAALAVIPVGDPQAAALSLVSLATDCADQGWQVVLADLCRGAPAARLLGVKGSGVREVDVQLTVVVPDRADLVPVGPLGRGPRGDRPDPARPRRARPDSVAGSRRTRPDPACGSLTAACASADLLLTLVALDPAVGAEHLAGWAGDAVAVVTAGRSSAERIHAVGEMTRLAGVQLVSAVLVGADKTDESLGVPHTPGPADPRSIPALDRSGA